jgi:predicted dehydrogenase
LRIALAGLGTAVSRGHLPAIARLASEGTLTLAGAADPDARRRASVGAGLPATPLFESAEAMLASVSCDVLVVAADPSMHADLVVLGLERGLHVVCEKPLVLTRGGYDRVARAHARRLDLGLVSVHQYRYSPTWTAMSRCAWLASRLHLPFALVVDVKREGVDPLAASPWRSDIELSGGMLADHGVHYLALAWMVDQHLDVLAGSRTANATGERSGASVRIGSGALTIQASTGNAARRTQVTLHIANVGLRWRDEAFDVVVAGRTVLSRPVATLADRSYVDALYEHLYRDLVRNLARPAWRGHRTAETLAVGRALLVLLDLTSAQPPRESDPVSLRSTSRPRPEHR